MDPISIKLPESLRALLSAEARRRQVSQSAIVRESLENTLGASHGGNREISCIDLARGLVGTVKSGRSDLATDKRFLTEAMLSDARKNGRRRRR